MWSLSSLHEHVPKRTTRVWCSGIALDMRRGSSGFKSRQWYSVSLYLLFLLCTYAFFVHWKQSHCKPSYGLEPIIYTWFSLVVGAGKYSDDTILCWHVSRTYGWEETMLIVVEKKGRNSLSFYTIDFGSFHLRLIAPQCDVLFGYGLRWYRILWIILGM